MSNEPRRLGKYELRTRLAQGGMGEVWKAFDTQLERYVAIKLLRTDLQHDPEFVERFEREALLVAALRHPNIVQVHDFQVVEDAEEERSIAYMVMDYIEGQTLADYIRHTSRKGQFPSASDIIYLFTTISLAIDYAHQQGMVHRDIKPANILLDQHYPSAKAMGEPMLTDFGIARLQGVTSGTVKGSLLGTPLYISPEQAQAQPGDKRSDLYSLGVILYEIMTGVTPFRGDSTLAILYQHIHDMPTSPRLINPQIPEAISSIILKSLAKEPDDRFQSAKSMTIALAEAFNVPVPGSLRRSSASSQASARPSPSSLTPASSPPPGPAQHYTPVQNQNIYVNVPVQRPVPLPTMTPAASPVPPAAQYPQYQYQSAPSAPAAPPQDAVPRASRQSRNRLIILIAALLLLLVGAGAGIFVFARPTPPAPPISTKVGTIQFSSSGHAAQGGLDQVTISLPNVPDPPAGRVYYAWIESVSSETDVPHWRLSVTNGAILATNLTYRNQNLFTPGTTLLITVESANTPPVIPYTDPSARRYYASITQASSNTFSIQSCPPPGSSSNVCVSS